MEGFLEKLGSGTFAKYQKRWFRVRNAYLCYYEKQTDRNPKKAFDLRWAHRIVEHKELISKPLGTTAAKLNPKHDIMIQFHGGKLLCLRAPNTEEKTAWMAALSVFDGYAAAAPQNLPILTARRNGALPDAKLAPLSPLAIPAPLHTALTACLAFVRARGVSTAGLFRVSGSQKEIDALFREFLFGRSASLVPASASVAMPDIHAVANVLKKCLRSLPESLLTAGLFGVFIVDTPHDTKPVDSKVEDDVYVARLADAVKQLPAANRVALQALVEVCVCVSHNQSDTQMDVGNLALCVGPALRPDDDGLAALAGDKPAPPTPPTPATPSGASAASPSAAAASPHDAMLTTYHLPAYQRFLRIAVDRFAEVFGAESPVKPVVAPVPAPAAATAAVTIVAPASSDVKDAEAGDDTKAATAATGDAPVDPAGAAKPSEPAPTPAPAPAPVLSAIAELERDAALSGGKAVVARGPDFESVGGALDRRALFKALKGLLPDEWSSAHVKLVATYAHEGRLVSCSNATAQVWAPSLPTAAHHLTLTGGHGACINAAIAMCDGSRIATAADDGTLCVWDAEANPTKAAANADANGGGGANAFLLATIKVKADIQCVAAVPGPFKDDDRVAIDQGKAVHIYSPVTQRLEVVCEGHTQSIWALTALSDGRLASAGSDLTIRVWRIPPAQEAGSVPASAPPQKAVCDLVLKHHTRTVFALAQLPDGRLVSGGYDKSVAVWNVVTGERVVALPDAHKATVSALLALRDGRFVSASDDGLCHVWAPWTSYAFHRTHTFEGHTKLVRALALLPDGRVASGSRDGTVRLWIVPPASKEMPAPNTNDGAQRVPCDEVLFGHDFPVQCLVALP